MFYDFFSWFCDRIVDIFNQFKTFPLFNGFTYFNFVIFLFAIPMFIRIIHFIMQIEDEEPLFSDNYTSNYYRQYDYVPKHERRYHGKHEYIPPKHAGSNSWFYNPFYKNKH